MLKTLTTAGSAAIVATTLALSGASAATILTNGSFETGVPGNTPGLVNGANYADMPTTGPDSDVWAGLNGWSLHSGPGIEVQTQRTLGLTPKDGNYYAELDSLANSVMYQTVRLNVGKYMLSFWYSPQVADATTNGISYRLGGLVSGLVTGLTPGAVVGDWVEITAEYVVRKAGYYRLAFQARGRSDGVGGLLDNVAIASIPVPASGLVLLAGLGGLAALRRRKMA